MKTHILLLAGVAALSMLTAADARNSDWQNLIIGAPSYLTCGKFNKLGKVEKNAALSWALGYISGMATSNAEEARLGRVLINAQTTWSASGMHTPLQVL